MIERFKRAFQAFVEPPKELPEAGRDGKWQIMEKMMKSVHSWNLPKGDYLEFGVYRGMSFKHAYHRAQAWGLRDMHFYAFDSFQGLPDDFTDVEDSYEHFRPNQYACSQEDFRTILEEDGVDLDKVTMVPGYYEHSLTRELQQSLPIQRASVVWIDVDIYTATLEALDFVTPFIGQGTFIAFDDWYCFGADPNAGEIRGVNEWLEKNPDIRLYDYHFFHTAGKAFLVQRGG